VAVHGSRDGEMFWGHGVDVSAKASYTVWASDEGHWHLALVG
jgi:hypothetical protein